MSVKESTTRTVQAPGRLHRTSGGEVRPRRFCPLSRLTPAVLLLAVATCPGVFAVAQEITIGQAAAPMHRSERRIRRLLAANGASSHAGTRPLRPPTARRQPLVVPLNAAQAWSAPSASASSPMSRSMRTQP